MYYPKGFGFIKIKSFPSKREGNTIRFNGLFHLFKRKSTFIPSFESSKSVQLFFYSDFILHSMTRINRKEKKIYNLI